MAGLKLNKKGNSRGMNPASKVGQFATAKVVLRTPPSKRSPQMRLQAERLNAKTAKTKGATTQKLTGAYVQSLIDDVLGVGGKGTGKGVKKSLMGMANKIGASPEDIERIYNADEEKLKKYYDKDKLIFEAYWSYPVDMDDDRSATLDEILTAVGV